MLSLYEQVEQFLVTLDIGNRSEFPYTERMRDALTELIVDLASDQHYYSDRFAYGKVYHFIRELNQEVNRNVGSQIDYWTAHYEARDMNERAEEYLDYREDYEDHQL